MLDFSAAKQRQRDAWAAGDFSRIATTTTLVGELLCESVDVRAGQDVLDVATGSGNTALAAARRGCQAVGIDFVPSLLERARQRAAVERLEATFQDGDAEHIPFADASFDVVLSTFGVMFAPDQQQAASEILRVCRGGGKIGLANWTPESFVGQIERVAAAYRPPPTAGLRSPILWGLEPHVRELLGEKVRSVRAQKRVCLFRARSVQHWLEFNITYLGHAKRTLESLDPTMQERLLRGMTDVARHFNRSGDDTFVAASEYLEVVAIRG